MTFDQRGTLCTSDIRPLVRGSQGTDRTRLVEQQLENKWLLVQKLTARDPVVRIIGNAQESTRILTASDMNSICTALQWGSQNGLPDGPAIHRGYNCIAESTELTTLPTNQNHV